MEVIYQNGLPAMPENLSTAHNHFPIIYKTITANSVCAFDWHQDR